MKEYIFVLGMSILFVIVVSHWNFVTAISAEKTPANVTLYTQSSNYSHPHTQLKFSTDTSSYLHWKLSGR